MSRLISICALVGAITLGIAFGSSGAAKAQQYRVLRPAGTGPFPAVLLVSGCSGFRAFGGIDTYDQRAAELQAAGYIVVYVDYLRNHGLSRCNGGAIAHATVGQDILAAARWVRSQPGVNPNRVYAIGWSFGGGGLISALDAMPVGPKIIERAVMYYPDCRGARPWAAGVRVLMLMGASDDVAPPSLCSAVIHAEPPEAVHVLTYPGAYHGFDAAGIRQPIQFEGGTVGYNAAAAAASWGWVRSFLN
jgi:dienelactone hydrolase